MQMIGQAGPTLLTARFEGFGTGTAENSLALRNSKKTFIFA